MKNIITILLLFFVLLFGCNNIGNDPEKTLIKYLEASFDNDYKTAYTYISSGDKSEKSLEEYESKSEGCNPAFRKNISFEVKSVIIKDNRAEIDVVINLPNYELMTAECLATIMKSFYNGNRNDYEKEILEYYKDKNIPMISSARSYVLIKESDGWKLFFNWKLKNKYDVLLNQIKQLIEEDNPDDAQTKYQGLIELGKSINDRSGTIEDLGKEILNLKEKHNRVKEIKEYIKNILINNVHLDKTYSGDIAVMGEIKNCGTCTLDKVEITIYCLDKMGKPIFEKKYYPVFVVEGSFGNNQPLKPNYGRKFTVDLDDVPNDWAKKVDLHVTDVIIRK